MALAETQRFRGSVFETSGQEPIVGLGQGTSVVLGRLGAEFELWGASNGLRQERP